MEANFEDRVSKRFTNIILENKVRTIFTENLRLLLPL